MSAIRAEWLAAAMLLSSVAACAEDENSAELDEDVEAEGDLGVSSEALQPGYYLCTEGDGRLWPCREDGPTAGDRGDWGVPSNLGGQKSPDIACNKCRISCNSEPTEQARKACVETRCESAC